MPLDGRKIAIYLSVIFFFCLSIVTLISGLSPFTCCKRAIAGAIIVYFISAIAVKVINIIIVDAMMTEAMEKRENSGISKKGKSGR